MTWAFEDGARRLQSQLTALKQAGLKLEDGQVLCVLMQDLSEEVGEITTVIAVKRIGQIAGLSVDAVGRSLVRLREAGLIVRKQEVRRAGEVAYTTLLPAAFASLGLPHPGSQQTRTATDLAIPPVLRELLCTQSWDFVDAVAKAWNTATALPVDIARTFRGGAQQLESIEQVLRSRIDEAHVVIETAIHTARAAEARRAAGMDLVETLDGPVDVDVKGFEAACPRPVPWSFVRDVLDEIRHRDIRLLTKRTLSHTIAEAAYARAALSFVKDKGWHDSVRLLGKQMVTRWSRPRRITKDWYTAASAAVIHKAVKSASQKSSSRFRQSETAVLSAQSA